jgi:hypothetical protein
LSIPKVNEDVDETSDIGKKMSMVMESTEIAYTKIILLIDVMALTVKLLFSLLKDARPRIIQTLMVKLTGRVSRINTNLFLYLRCWN